MKKQNVDRLVFVDESRANIAMGRSHGWVQKGFELVDSRPTNWGNNLTMVGAVRSKGFIALSTQFESTNKKNFSRWIRLCLAPKLKHGDIVLLDNAKPHKDDEVRRYLRKRGVRLKFLPPYSHDLNPIEPAWALVKKEIRRRAPRTKTSLRHSAQCGRHRVKERHCVGWFRHSGYVRGFK